MTVRAAGTVLWRPAANGPEIALVHRPRHGDWTLPKGKPKTPEPLVAAARRETVEETGYDVAVGAWVGTATYRDAAHRVEKRVDYWAARPGDAAGEIDPDEVDKVEWLPLDAARERLTWESDRGVLARLRPVATTTVLLVRHARAGSRETWPGPDDERPLDPWGQAQRDVLAAALPAFWLPDETPLVVSAPVTRCVETVAWAGDVRRNERLGERTFADYPDAATAAVRDVAGHGVAIVCSQGGVVPYVVESLRRADGLRPAGVRAAKGSTWVLSFANGRLVAADYLDAI